MPGPQFSTEYLSSNQLNDSKAMNKSQQKPYAKYAKQAHAKGLASKPASITIKSGYIIK